MTKYIAILSGKGGAGKSTSSINLGTALNYFGKDVTIVDANLTTPNIGIYLGVPVVPINIHHVLQGKNHISEAVYLHTSGTKIVPGSISLKDLKTTNPLNLKRVLRGLYGTTDIVLIDSAAGLGRDTLLAVDACDSSIIVTNPELPAITDALKTIKVVEEMGKKVLGVILTRTKENNFDLSIKNIESILGKPVISRIPEDKAVREALIRKDPVVLTHPDSLASIEYKRLAALLLGRKYQPEQKKEETKGFFERLFERFKK
ncbi:P-loop NTPase [Candidatus Woesearchaeota archaeon]|nr:P-loop NTPase [Candidatus Woesearchaeota archaeon]